VLESLESRRLFSLPPGAWQMIWQDEFNGNQLDPVWHHAQYWDTDFTINTGELQVYDRSALSVSGGELRITARRESLHGMEYVSGLAMTGGVRAEPEHPRFNFRFGYLEVRAKLVSGKGLWPAVWMMPASYDDDNGEIDVMELIGQEPSKVHLSIHRQGQHESTSFSGPDFSQGYHTFGVDWRADQVTWYVDDVVRATVTNPALICPEAMYPIINMAVGGQWPGAPDGSTPFPSTMNVDYIRVYQPAGGDGVPVDNFHGDDRFKHRWRWPQYRPGNGLDTEPNELDDLLALEL
jgi:beta-glucanase (GH16 family)